MEYLGHELPSRINHSESLSKKDAKLLATSLPSASTDREPASHEGTYQQCEFQTTPDKSSHIGVRLRKGIEDRGVLLDRLQNPTQPAGHAATSARRILVVQLGGEGDDGIGVRHALQRR